MAAQDVNIKINVDANQAEQSTTNYKKTLKDLQAQMVELQVSTNGLANATDEQREQYAALEQQAGKLSDAISDVSTRVRANADDYQTFNAALEGLKGGAAVAQGLVGTLDLLGISNTGVEQLLKTLMSLQGVMNSVNAVQQIFNKDSKVRILLTKMLGETSAKTTATEVAQAGATTTLAASEKTAEKAQLSLNAAMSANPVMAIVAGIAALVAILGVAIKLINKETEEEKRANAVKAQRVEIEQKIREAVGETKTTLAGYLDVLKNTNVTEGERKILLGEIEKATSGVITANEAEKMSLEELEKAVYNYITALETEERQKALIAKKIELETEREEAQRKANESGRKKDVKALLEVQAKYDDVTEALSKNTSEIVKNRIAQAKANEEKKKDTETAENLGKKAEAWKAYNKERSEAQKEYAQTLINNAIADAEYDKDWNRLREARKNKENAVYEETTKKYKEQLKQKLLTKKQYDELILSAEEVHNNNLLEINREADKKIWEDKVANLETNSEEYYTQYQQLLDEALANNLISQKEYDSVIKKMNDKRSEEIKKQYEIDSKKEEAAKIKGRIDGLKEGTPEYLETLIEYYEAQRDLELAELEKDKEEKLLSEEVYQKSKKEIIDKYNTENLESTLNYIEKERIAKEQLIDTLKATYSALFGFVEELQTSELQNAEGNEKKQAQIKKKYAIIKGTMQIAQIVIDTIQSAVKAYEVGLEAGFPAGLVLGPALAAATAAFGAVQVATASAQMANNIKAAKAARGAFVTGASHSEGGVMMELEGGEAVLNKRAMAIPQYRSLASAMNVATGGVAFPNSSKSVSIINKDDLRAVVSETVAAVTAIPVVVSEQSITNAQRKVGVIEGRSRF